MLDRSYGMKPPADEPIQTLVHHKVGGIIANPRFDDEGRIA
jgi:hypothetical protein